MLRLKLQTNGSAHSVQQYYLTHKKQTIRTLKYYDAAIAAKRIKIPVHFACALYDPCVAPPGQFAIYNAVTKDKHLYVLEAGHHRYSNQVEQEKELIEQLDIFFNEI